MRRSVVNFQGVVRYLASRNVTKRQLTFLRKATAGAVIELEKLQSEASARQPRTILDLRSRILRLGGCGKKTVDQMLDILEDQKIIWSCPKCGEGVISSDLILQSLRQLRDHLAQA